MLTRAVQRSTGKKREIAVLKLGPLRRMMNEPGALRFVSGYGLGGGLIEDETKEFGESKRAGPGYYY